MSKYLIAGRHLSGATNILLSTARGFCVAAILGMFVPASWAQGTTSSESQHVAARYPSGSINSVEMAETALAEVRQERAEIEARLIKEQQACHPKFFVTACVDEAKERRRRALAQLRPIEIEANTFKRQARVTARDQALEKKRKPEATDNAGRLEQEGRAEKKTAAPADDAVEPSKSDGDRKVQSKIFPDRQARHDAKLKRAQEEEAAQAQKRAENVAAYEKKVQAAQARQKEVEARKAEKEQNRKMKEAPSADSTSASKEK
jgi:colicin import membrane protein